MTIVVAVRKGARTVIAADSMTSFGNEKQPLANLSVDKLRRVGESWIGHAGWGLYEQILDDVLASRRPAALTSSRAVFRFFLHLWHALKERYPYVNEQSADKETPFADLDATFLVANRQGIFMVASNLTVTRFQRYQAIGGGAPYALGALHARYDREDDPVVLAREAVATAIAFDVHCGGETRLEEVGARRTRGAGAATTKRYAGRRR
jgi:ATP-dependent HslUV protease subunit HslV